MTDLIPPHEQAAEEALLGGLFFSADAVTEATSVLTPHDFFVPVHQRIFQAVCDLNKGGIAIDQVTVATKLDAEERMTVLDLASKSVNARNTSKYAAIIKDKARLRTVIRECNRLTTLAYEGTDVLSDALQTMMRLQDAGSRHAARVGDLVDERLKHMGEKRPYFECPGGSPHIKPGNLIVLGGRPGTGKSALALWWADEWSIAIRCAFFSYEMDEGEIADRLICNRTKTPIESLDEGWSADEIDVFREAMSELKHRNLYVKVAAGLSETQLLNALRTFRAGGGLVAFVDYIQLAADDTGNPTNDVARLSKLLKRTALDTGLVIVALSQFKRPSGEQRNPYPTLTDFKQSGALEQDANIACLLYRYPPNDEEPGIEARRALVEKGHDIGMDDTRDLLRLDWAKVRQGKPRLDYHYFDGSAMRFQKVGNIIRCKTWQDVERLV